MSGESPGRSAARAEQRGALRRPRQLTACPTGRRQWRTEYGTETASDFLANHITIGFAEHEHLVIGERTREALVKRARNGLWNGGYIFGFRKDETTEKLVPHAAEAEIVRKHIFDAFEALGSVGRVVQRLHELGVRYPIQRSSQAPSGGKPPDKPFDKQIVRRILENDVNLGHVIWGEIRSEDAHPAIIEVEQFKRVGRLLNHNRRWRTNTRYFARNSGTGRRFSVASSLPTFNSNAFLLVRNSETVNHGGH